MKYALNLAEDGRILSATYERFAHPNAILVEELPGNNVADYCWVEGKYIYNPICRMKVEDAPERMDVLEAQIIYTAMMTDTLLEV